MAAMASTNLAPTLEVTAADDDMEILSDTGRMDHDIDIEIDAAGSHTGDHDIDYMLEDAKDYQEGGQNDDLMIDEIDPTVFAEEDMHDDVVADEHLTDALGPTHENFETSILEQETTILQVFENTEIPQVPDLEPDEPHQSTEEVRATDEPTNLNPTQSELLNTDNLDQFNGLHDDTAYHDVENEGPNVTEQKAKEVEAGGVVLDQSNPDENTTSFSQPSANEEEYRDPNQSNPDTLVPGETAADNQSGQVAEPQENETTTEVHDSTGFEAELATSAEDTPLEQREVEQSHQQPESAESNSPDFGQDNHSHVSLHPVLVKYESDEISLFPPLEEDGADTYLLHDPSVAYNDMGELFKACRQVLGESIDEGYVLEMSIDKLGLSISEDSVDCPSTNMYQIIDVYLHLHRNDGVEHPEPLYLTLTTKPRFPTRLSVLLDAAREFKGFSELPNPNEERNEDADGSEDQAEEEEEWNEEENENEAEEASDYVQDYQEEHAEEEREDDQVHGEEEQDEKTGDDQEPVLTHDMLETAEDSKGDSDNQLLDPVQESTVDQTAEEAQIFGEDDLIDYSDDEAKEEEVHTSGSSTVQEEQATSEQQADLADNSQSDRKFSVPDDGEAGPGESTEHQEVNVAPTDKTSQPNDSALDIQQFSNSTGEQSDLVQQPTATDDDQVNAQESTDYNDDWHAEETFEGEEGLFDNEEADWAAYTNVEEATEAHGDAEAFHDDEYQHQELVEGIIDAGNIYETVNLEGEEADGHDTALQSLDGGESPSGKRSWEEHAEDYVLEGDEQDSKRVRSR